MLEVKSGKFLKSQKHYFNFKKSSIFIQTDKPVYKPSDLGRFRVLILDEDTKPLQNLSNVQIFITDGNNHCAKQFDEIKFYKGVYQNELNLTDSTVLGKWKVEVKVNGEENFKTFEVAEYVLPQLEVIIDTKADIYLKDEIISATIMTNHQFGNAAKGKVSVTATVKHVGYSRGKNNISVSKTFEIDGKNTVEFDIRNYMKNLWKY